MERTDRSTLLAEFRRYAKGLWTRTVLEIRLWRMHVLKLIPGQLGYLARNMLLPYRRGKKVTVWDHVHIENPERLEMGDHVSINRYSILHAGGGIAMGNHVLVGPRVTIYSQNHRFDTPGITIDKQGYDFRPVNIGSNVWLSANVIVLPGVTIGDNTVVGAGSVVTQDIEGGWLALGNPARPVRRLKHS
jgi:maltose O-acetyltransferase